MGDIFLKLLNMGITAGWLILAVLCIRLVFQKIPKWVICLLWGAVAIRLVCPFSIESPLSILPSTELVKSSATVEGQIQNHIPSIDSRLTIVENAINPILAETFAYNASDSAAPLQIVTYIADMIWAGGMFLLTLYAIGSMVKLHKLVAEAVCIRDNLYICDAVKSPFILGIIKPRVYLSSSLDEKEMNYITAHETAHLKRKDHWWKPLGYLLLCIYWFNPLCWAAYAVFCKDIELACDEKTVRDMTFQEKKEYSRILLSCAGQRNLVMVCPLAFGEIGIRKRVQSVLHYRKPAFWTVLVSGSACLLIAVCFFTTSPKTFQVKVILPADGTEYFYYSDEEISPKGNTLTLYAGEGMGDGEVVLLPVEVHEDNTYKPTYITPGMPVKMDVEKGAWYKLGVAYMRNSSGEDMEVYLSVENVVVRIAAADERNTQESEPLSVRETEDKLETSAQNVILHEQPEADKVCIKVQPSMLREQTFYYYIPTGTDQEWLSRQIQALDLEGKPFDRRWEGHKETGWQIVYQGMEIRTFEGGYLYYTYNDAENKLMECFIEAPKLCDYIQIMLIGKAGHQHSDISDIKDITSAKLEVHPAITADGRYHSQTITDTETLQKFEEWFCSAESVLSGTDCGYKYACLELTLANGNVIRLSMATDSCPNFSLDGAAYNYRPVSDWDNSEFFRYFNEIPLKNSRP